MVSVLNLFAVQYPETKAIAPWQEKSSMGLKLPAVRQNKDYPNPTGRPVRPGTEDFLRGLSLGKGDRFV